MVSYFPTFHGFLNKVNDDAIAMQYMLVLSLSKKVKVKVENKPALAN